MTWKVYRRRGFTEIRPYEMGEDLTNVSVQPGYEPQQGDMIARRYDDPKDMWVIEASYFKDNYDLVVQE